MISPLPPPSTPRVALIAGITGGIGRATAERLHGSGWQLAGYARTADTLAALAHALPGLTKTVTDATDPVAVEQAARAAVAAHGRLDAYVHCIGSILLKPAHLTRPDEWQRTLDLNLTSAFHGLRAALAAFGSQSEGGSIVLLSSTAAQVGLPNHEAIAAAKAGVEGLVRAAAATYAARNIRINAVAPGLIDTPLSAPLLTNDIARQASEKLHPLGRVGRPAHIAATIAWLLSADADWVTGQCIAVDGGLSTVRARPRV